jgi:replicative DNA helicase
VAKPIQMHPGTPQPEEPLESPEVLALNALLRSGRFDPQVYGIDADMLAGYQTAWNFCQDYQDQVGAPPPIELFARKFPTIEIIGGTIDPRWAADRLRAAHYEREMRRALGEATRALRDGDVDAAREVLKEINQPNPLTKPKGMNITDVETVAETGVTIGFNTPWPTLTAGTNGHERGGFWLLGARLGQGKSQLVPGYVIAAAKMGARVAVASCEMPMRQYTRRIHRWQTEGDLDLQRALASTEEQTRKAALMALPKLAGSVEVFDPSVMRMNIRSIEALASEYDVVWIDHVGLLQDVNGKRAIEDWRIAAVISNSLKEIALRFGVALGGAVQINREGETAGSNPPKVSNLSQTDALGQDADVVITLKRLGVRSMLHNCGKNREGHDIRFYTKFEPAKGDFSEISGDEARLRELEDQNRLANA